MTTVLIAIAALLGLAALFGAVLGYASEKFKVEGDPIVEQIDALLPQTQCGQWRPHRNEETVGASARPINVPKSTSRRHP